MLLTWLSALFLLLVAVPGLDAADARRGRDLFRTHGCATCHAAGSEGASGARDLAVRRARGFRPAEFVATMWNHAPTMWAAMDAKGVERRPLNPSDASDLLAFFHQTGFFEPPGDAGRGKAVFESRRCAACHSLTAGGASTGTPVPQWRSLHDPYDIARYMWNHALLMMNAMRERGWRWSNLSGQELRDLFVYVRNLPQTRDLPAELILVPPGSGGRLLEEKGCLKCHAGKLAFDSPAYVRRMADQSLADLAAAMWNHTPRMQQPEALSGEEMRQILGAIWSRRFFLGAGDERRGKRVFERRNCASCHGGPSPSAPQLQGRQEYSAPAMISALWGHGPTMRQQAEAKRLAWPRFSPGEMEDLIAFLNTSQ